jgi:hypothetical protein
MAVHPSLPGPHPGRQCDLVRRIQRPEELLGTISDT